MRSYGPDGHAQRMGDLLVGTLFLMIEDEDGSLDLAEPLELLFDGLLKLALLYLFLSIAIRVREAVFPAGGVVGEGDVGTVVATAALPLVLGNVDRDAVKVGSHQGFAAKAGQGTIEPEEDVLGKVVEMLPAAREAQKGSEDHLLMVEYHLLEAEIGVQAGLDLKQR
jgi:hypothetical protein